MANKPCLGCTKNDDHPRHQVGLTSWHMDCHVLATDCEACEAQLDAADAPVGGEVKGDELRQRLIALRDNNNTQEG